MPIAFTCPKCGQKLTLTASKPGDWLDCPNCEATITVPGGEPPKPARAPAAAKAPAPEPLELDDEPVPARGLWSDKRVQLGAVAGGMGLLFVALLVLAFTQKRDRQPEQVRNDPPPAAQPAAPPVAPLAAPVKPKENPPPKPKENQPPKPVTPVESVAVAPPPRPVAAKPPPDFINLDQFGNPIDQNTGLAKQDEFKGQRLLLWVGYPTHYQTFFGPDNPLWKALEEKGFVVQKEFGPFRREKLKDSDQVWLFSGAARAGPTTLNKDDYDALEAFARAGKGVCLLADNDPFYVEADELAKRLFGAKIRDDYKGTKIAYVRRPQITPEDIKKYKGDYEVADHPLLAGVNFVYEGITISNVSASDKLEVAMKASDGKPVLALSKVAGLRVVIDCGYTRYCYGATEKERFITKTAGSVRLAQNIAAYLAGKELTKEP